MPDMMPPPSDHRPPFNRYQYPVIIARPVVCRTVTDNQNTIDALQALVDNCDKLRAQGRLTCHAGFKASVQKELDNQRAIGVVVGQDCNTTSNSVLTYNRYY